MQLRNHSEALGWANAARRWNADAATVELVVARIHRRWGDLDAMDSHLRLAKFFGVGSKRIEREQMLADAQSGQLQDTEQPLRDWMAEPGNDVADICDAYTNGLIAHARLDDARVLLNVWQVDCPYDPQPHVKRGRIADFESNAPLAEQEFRLALSKNVRYTVALYAFATFLLKEKRPDEALPLFLLCSEIDEQAAAAANVGAATCQRLSGETNAARKLVEPLRGMDEASVRRAYDRLGSRPELKAAALELGILESEAGNLARAETLLRDWLTESPHDLDTWYRLGVVLRDLGRVDGAKEIFDRVEFVHEQIAEMEPWENRLAADPADSEARYQIGVTLLKYRSADQGLFWLRRVLAYDPAHVKTHQALAEYYRAHASRNPNYSELAEHHQRMADQNESEAK